MITTNSMTNSRKYSKIFFLSSMPLLPLPTPLFGDLMVIPVCSISFLFNRLIIPPLVLHRNVSHLPSYQPHGHGIHICKFSRTPPVASSPDDLAARNIPTGVFYSPPSLSSSPNSTPVSSSLTALHRSLLSANPPSLSSDQSLIWSWWHSMGHLLTKTTSSSLHYNLLSRKLSHARNPLVTIPLVSYNWLLSHFSSLPAPSIRIVQDTYAILPIPLLSDLLTKYDLLHAKTPSPSSRSQFSSPPSATWTKCRVAAPKIWAHQGTIKSSDGTPCRTSHTLDLALRATRAFWQESPTPYHSSWTPLLTSYASANTPFPPSPPPMYDEFYHSVITSPDSAPGADGIPFSAYRVSPAVSAQALNSHFHSILSQQASPPVQTLVFIPKADVGDYADKYRPLGLPNSSDRLIDRAAYVAFTLSLLGSLHPAQALLNLFREPQANYLEVQNFLDDQSEHYAVLLSDLAKAFERVNPHWIMHVLFARQAPYWVLIYCRHILFGRKVLHKVGSFFRPPLPLNTGVDMGRAFSVLLFCVAMDPWYHHANAIPRVLVNKGYMDDNATGGQGLSWLLPTQNLINNFYEAGFQVLAHACYPVEPLSQAQAPLPRIEACSPVTQGYPSLLLAFQHLPPSPFVRLRSGSLSITVPTNWICCQDTFSIPPYPHPTSLLHCTPCNCKCKTYLLPNFQLSAQDLLCLDSTPFGAKIISPAATMLGLYTSTLLFLPYLPVVTPPLPHLLPLHFPLLKLKPTNRRRLCAPWNAGYALASPFNSPLRTAPSTFPFMSFLSPIISTPLSRLPHP